MSKRPGDYAVLCRELVDAVRDVLDSHGCDPDLTDSIGSSLWNLAMDAVNKANEPSAGAGEA